ncbi:hypothetical protein GCM10009555_053990 [Acrocarpospora macrocephala]|uniref:pPIWI-RE RNaseH domain-containing protein n=1 Tax=Acrocarpospora macrocephala TaxID=150177 RepID=A0A5M3WQ70_9ACTN|nr:RNaseH domain-containing protein [Acrocarpospora macrocephala]GES11094.1 hypothetical protein Amac_046910 [Acrocarpospora macrocephala]
MPAKLRRHLDMLAYRCTPRLLGDAAVYLREFDKGVLSMWRMLDRDYRTRMNNEEAQAPYSIATNALRFMTGGYAHLDTDRGYLVTREPIDDDLLCDTFTLLTRLAAGYHIDAIDLRDPSSLATRIAETPQQSRLLADYLRKTEHRQPDAWPWVYRCATWDLARELSRHVWEVDGKEITLRPDSHGGFIAWDHPWSDKTGTAHSLARCRMLMKTLPNISDPVILLSAAATRIQSGMAYARTALVEQADPELPIIAVEMAGRGRIRTIHRLTLETLAKLKVDHSILQGIQDRVDQEENARQEAEEKGEDRWYAPGGPLGRIRPIQGKRFKFPIGTGVGLFFERELDRHFREVFDDAAISPRVVIDTVQMKQRKQADILSTPDEVARSLRTMGYSHLRLVCLWYKDENRQRMIRGLCKAYGLDPAQIDPAEGVPIPLLPDTVSVVFHEVPTFLKHGPDSGREADLADITSLKKTPGTLVGVWAETEWDGQDDEEDPEEGGQEPNTELQDASVPQASNGKPSENEDAKHRSRRTLADLGVASQFMKDANRRATGPDHPAIYAQLDLSRSLGIIDRRIDNVMVDAIGPFPADGVAHCAIHVRRQSKRRGERAAKICITATVLKPPATTGDAWTLHGWSYTDRRWQPYGQAQTAFHARDYPDGKLTELLDDNRGYKVVASTIDQALNDLARYLDGIPYTVTVDGTATRRLWDGLHNNKQGEAGKPGTTWLPGHTLKPRYQPIAVIRLNKDTEETPRPFGATWIDEEEEIDKKDTATSLFRIETDFGHPAWLLVTVPPQFDGAKTGRLGKKNTRWTADHGSNIEGQLRKNEVAANWYAMTATEIYVIPLRDDVPPQPLARMTARLCHQPLTWSNRTRYCVHLHAAQKMDKDHPQYRRSELPDNPEADTPDDFTTGEEFVAD